MTVELIGNEQDPLYYEAKVASLNRLFRNHERAMLDNSISVVSMAHRTPDYKGFKLPKVFSAAHTMVVENNDPKRFSLGQWMMSHDEVCEAAGIPIEDYGKSTSGYLTSGYLFTFSADSLSQNYFFPSEASYMGGDVIKKLEDNEITVIDENYHLVVPVLYLPIGWQVQKLRTTFTQ